MTRSKMRNHQNKPLTRKSTTRRQVTNSAQKHHVIDCYVKDAFEDANDTAPEEESENKEVEEDSGEHTHVGTTTDDNEQEDSTEPTTNLAKFESLDDVKLDESANGMYR